MNIETFVSLYIANIPFTTYSLILTNKMKKNIKKDIITDGYEYTNQNKEITDYEYDEKLIESGKNNSYNESLFMLDNTSKFLSFIPGVNILLLGTMLFAKKKIVKLIEKVLLKQGMIEKKKNNLESESTVTSLLNNKVSNLSEYCRTYNEYTDNSILSENKIIQFDNIKNDESIIATSDENIDKDNDIFDDTNEEKGITPNVEVLSASPRNKGKEKCKILKLSSYKK